MDCYICMECIHEHELIELPCGHKYHKLCLIYELIEQLKICIREICCPYCRERQSQCTLNNYVDMITIKNGPFKYKYDVVPKYYKININNESYDSTCCSVYNAISGRQCKRQIKITFDNVYKNLDLSKLDTYNDYEFIKKSFCTYHSNNVDKIKYFVHPVYICTIRVNQKE